MFAENLFTLLIEQEYLLIPRQRMYCMSRVDVYGMERAQSKEMRAAPQNETAKSREQRSHLKITIPLSRYGE
jgi:hypothetical protein